MLYYNILLLAVIVVFIVDVSGIVDAMKEALGRWLHVRVGRLKPFDCSLCMVWWCGLAYLLIVGRFSLGPVAFVALMAACSVQIGAIIQLARAILQWLADTALGLIEK